MAQKKTSKKKQSARKKVATTKRGIDPVPEDIRVRVARLGAGGCVLLTLPKDGGGEFNILIDCGSGGTGKRAAAFTREVVADIGEATGGRIDLLVITSLQLKHLEGFQVAAEAFDRIEIGDLWLAWTEDPGDALAAEIFADRQERARAARIAAEVCRGEEIRPAEPSGKAERDLLESVVARVNGQVRYLRAGERLSLPGVEGISAFVLGPPRSELLSGRDSTDRCGVGAAGASGATPFDRRFCTAPVDAVEIEFFRTSYGFGDSAEDREKSWRKISSSDPPGPDPVGAMIDAEVGEASLALALQLDRPGGRRRVLLFPSEVPIASWSRWTGLSLGGQGANGKRIDGEQLLARAAWLFLGSGASLDPAVACGGVELVGGDDLVVIVSAAAQEQISDQGVTAPIERLREKARGRLILTGADALPDAATLDLSPAAQSAFAQNHHLTRLYVESLIPLKTVSKSMTISD